MTNRALQLRLGQPLGLPAIPDEDEYLVLAFFETGVRKPGAMGAVPLDWPDLLAYADGTGVIERGDDVAALYHMIRSYCAENDAATADALRIAPVESRKE